MIKKWLTLTIISVFTIYSGVSLISIVSGDIPSPPHRFRGYVIDETGNFAPDGTVVSAKLNNNFFNTTVKNGRYGFPTETEAFYVNGTAEDEGKTIYFYINGKLAPQTATYVPGGFNINWAPYFNLSLASPLTISSVTTSSITKTTATISWKTNIPANSTVNYGINKNLGYTKKDNNFVKNHSITLTNLQPGTTYYYEVISYDQIGNKAKDNNSENYYTFTTEEETENHQDIGGENTEEDNEQPPQNENPEGPIQSNMPPIADANGPYLGKAGNPITFDASNSLDPDGYIANYTWNFGDGNKNTTTNTTITHIFKNPGNYTITLTVTDNNGTTNSTKTFAIISTNDSDGDGWSDEEEQQYGTDPHNASIYPIDTDKDGLPDVVDLDDDNDGLTDYEEELIGTNETDGSDVINITTNLGTFIFLDLNGDGRLDKYYNKTSNLTIDLYMNEDGNYLIDINNDSKYDYIYSPTLGSIIPYNKPSSGKTGNQISYIYISVITFIAICLSIIIYFKFLKKNK
ncbi:MAG TPA: PKD domain-containing protein [Thermoplasmatales archaeon]|nr:PKD domain-containing protein [Thermoplasmatales archaeon]HEX08423.1 PKD domain-containing protein [Thermoplasmatales archaeon]